MVIFFRFIDEETKTKGVKNLAQSLTWWNPEQFDANMVFKMMPYFLRKKTEIDSDSVTQITRQWGPQMVSQLCLIYTWESSVTWNRFTSQKQKQSFANYLVNPVNFSEAVTLQNKFYLAGNFDLVVCIYWRNWIITDSSLSTA